MEEQAKPAKKKKIKSGYITVALVAIMLLGIGIIAYPSISDWWNSKHASRAINNYTETVENTDTEELRKLLEAAYEYNRSILEKENPYRMTDEDLERYYSLLDVSGTGLMGYVQIPSVNINVPFYHGTDEDNLQTAAGHVDWTSLPVGGESTHSVLSGHRGLPSARLFTDLDKVKEGDIFILNVLDQKIYYEVDQIRIVLPDDVSELSIVRGEDYCTLVTCTPYGINSHRMLIRGKRVEGEDSSVLIVTPDATILPRYLTISAVAIPLLFIFLVVLMIFTRGKKRSGVKIDLESVNKQIEEIQKKGGLNE